MTTSHQYATVLQAWLAFPALDTVDWPYTYLRADDTASNARAKRTDLFNEFDNLAWRLEGGGYATLTRTIDEWRSRLAGPQTYRLPGDWSPAWLMAHPYRSPPIARVAAIGVCQPPDWVEVWDASGIARTPWRGGLRLSDLSRDDGPLDLHGADQVALVTPEGAIKHYGQAAFNYSDVDLRPGTRVIAALPLGGEAFPWIRDAIADLLAHTPVGRACQEMPLLEEDAQDD